MERVRRAFATHGLDAALQRQKAVRTRRRKRDGAQEAYLIAVTCRDPPEGRERWTLALIADKLVELGVVDTMACEMEDGLDLYARPHDLTHPLVCFDESTKEQHREVVESLPVAPGQAACYERTDERNGVRNLFMFFAPLENWRHVKSTDRRTTQDWTQCMRDLVDVHVPHAEKIVLVQDNRNTHTSASRYAAFPPAEAKRIWDRLEFHDTPKHGRWLTIAEMELSVLSQQCLDRRIPDQDALCRDVTAWFAQRNTAKATIDWRFTTADARIKLKKLYPTLNSSE